MNEKEILRNEILDQIIMDRKSTRKFKNEPLSKEYIEEVITAGLYAPYSGITGMKLEETRKIFVIQGNSEEMIELRKIMYKEIRKKARVFKLLSKVVPKLRKEGKSFNLRIQSMANSGIPSLDNAPVYIIVAEKKGIPASANLAIAHVMQNMWLKATSLNLGFQLLSLTKVLVKNKNFMKRLGLEYGKYEIDGCIVGYPFSDKVKNKNIDINKYIKWL